MAENVFAPLPTGGSPSPGSHDGLFVVGGQVRTPMVATWPARCVVCNCDVPAADFKATLVWYPRWTIVVFVLSWLIGVILMMIMRKTATLHVGLCDEHRAARKRNLLIWGGVFTASILAFPLGFMIDVGALVAIGTIGFLVGLIGMAVVMKPLRLARVENDMGFVVAKPAFRDSLPRGG